MTNTQGWQEVQPANTQSDRAPIWNFQDQGPLVGKYIDTLNDIGRNNSNLHKFEVNGDQWAVWGTAVLDSRLRSIALQTEVMVEYHGKKINRSTGRSFHDFKVYTKPTGTAPSSPPAPTTEDIPF